MADKPTFASVTDKPCTCGNLESYAEDPDIPICFDPEMREFNIRYSTSLGQQHVLRIHHCPFCGGCMPESLRAEKFEPVSTQESHRLCRLAEGLKTLDDVVAKFGAPDQDFPFSFGPGSETRENPEGPRVKRFYRALRYSSLSAVAIVDFTETESGIGMAIFGKLKRPSDS